MSPLLKFDLDVVFANGYSGGCLDEVLEDVAGFGGLIAVANRGTQEPIKTAGHEGQLQITVHFHGHSRGKRIHVEEINTIGNIVFDQHPLGIAADQFCRGSLQLIGQQ